MLIFIFVSFICIPDNYELGQVLNIEDIIFEEDNKKLIVKVIDELEKGELNFGNVDTK